MEYSLVRKSTQYFTKIDPEKSKIEKHLYLEPYDYRILYYVNIDLKRPSAAMESIFLSMVEGRGFPVEGEGTMSRVEGNIFFSSFFFWKG